MLSVIRVTASAVGLGETGSAVGLDVAAGAGVAVAGAAGAFVDVGEIDEEQDARNNKAINKQSAPE